MHVPGHNPYVTTTGGEDFDINAFIQYITDIESQSGTIWQPAGGGWNVEYDPQYAEAELEFNVNLPTYGYQGMSPEIMQALGNVLTPTGGFNPEMFGEDFIMSQILSQTPGLSEADLPGMITSMPGTAWGGSFDPTIGPGGIGEWDYGDIESALPFTDVFDAESIAATLSQIGGFTSDNPDDTLAKIRAGEVKALTPEMIEKTTAAYYDPIEDVGRQKLIGEKTKALGKAATGGFAGSGARASGLSGAEQMYRGGYGKLLEGIMGQQAGATENVLDTVYGWQELLSNQ